MTDLTRDDLLHLLATRHEMIDPICNGSLDKRSIRRRLDVSRPTVDRAFRELEELGMLTSTGTAYELTRFGRLFCERFHDQVSTVDQMVEVGDLLAHLPGSAAIDERMLEGARVLETEPHAPLAPLTEVGELATDADRIEGYTNALLPNYVSFVKRGVSSKGMGARIILPEAVMEVAFEEYMEQLSELLDAPEFTLVKTHETIPFGVLVVDDEAVGVSIRDDENRLRGALVNESAAAVEWATEQLDRLAATGEEYEFTRSGRSVRAD